MSASIQINIAEPCHESWQHMTPNEQGRFCGACQKTVVDFSMMSDQEILDYISKANSSICGRAMPEQLNKKMPITQPKKRYTLAYVWNLILATFLWMKGDAQVQPIKSTRPPVTVAPDRVLMGKIAYVPKKVACVSTSIHGIVTDAVTGAPLEAASITVKDRKGGTVADNAGHFQLPVNTPGKIELIVSMLGYEVQTVSLDEKTNRQQLTIRLKPAASVMGEVEVISYPSTSCRSMMGGLGYIRTVTITEKIKRNINDWKPAVMKKDVRVFPNPVVRGNSMQLNLALKQAGEFKLELLNTAGQVVAVQSIQMPEKERVITVPTQAGWSAGVYWVRISSQQVKTVYQSKVLIK